MLKVISIPFYLVCHIFMIDNKLHKKRDSSLDLIRTIAILCVVLNHAVEFTYPIATSKEMAAFSLAKQVLCYGCFVIGRGGVPLFFMLSGYLLLPREYDATKAGEFFRSKVVRMFIVWEIWIVIYQIFLSWYNQQPILPQEYIKRALFVDSAGLSHTWFMPTIIGMYLFIPFVSIVLRVMNDKTLLILMTICYLYVFVTPVVSLFLVSAGQPKIESLLVLSFGGGFTGFYLITGYMMARYRDLMKEKMSSRTIRCLILFIGIVSLLLTVWMQIYVINRGVKYSTRYNNAFLPVTAFCFFSFFKNIKLKPITAGLVLQISRCTFGIFCVHEMVMLPLMGRLGETFHNYYKLIILFTCAFVISFIIVEVLSKIPKIKILFLMK